MSGFLVDSNVLIEWLKGIPRAVVLLERLVSQREPVAVNAVSVAETYSGLFDEDRDRAMAFLSGFRFWPIGFDVAKLAGEFRFQYARRGRQYSVSDTLLAAHAISLDATLVTGNVRDFPMPELRILRLE